VNKVKHITIINQYIGSPYHGMEYRHYYIAKNLIAQGYKVTLITGSYSHLFSSLPKVKENFTKELIDGVEYIWVKVPSYKSSKSIGRIWNMIYFSWKLRFLKDLEPSHIIVSSPSLFPVKIGKKLSKKFNTKFLFEVRDIWPQTLLEMTSLKNTNPLIKYMEYCEKFAYKNADRVISLLPTAKEHYVCQGMNSDKFVYLPNGIEVKDKAVAKLPSHMVKEIPKDKFILAYSGTIGIANNLDYLIDVAELLRDNKKIHFILLGAGGEKDRLKNRVKNLNLENFSFLDAVDKEQVADFLSYVDVAFISLLPENLFRFGVSPNKIFDYMYAKKPIIWAIEAGNNLVEEANCGVTVLVNKTEQLRDAIINMSELTPKELNKLGENGYNFVIKNHSYEELSKELIKIVEE